ncbi:MAG: DUF7009 family protein [Acidobacteriaceae bacterium]
MKLRIRGDSLRFRLSQGEVSSLQSGDSVRDSIHFSDDANDALTYSLQGSDGVAQPIARFTGREIQVHLPHSAVDRWATSDEVGIEFSQPVNQAKRLRLIIEKDFRCLQPRPEEDEADNFPHPERAAESLNAELKN